MGTTYDASLICGFEIEIREATKKRTKYNEDTGEPYEVDVPSHQEIVIEGKVVADDKDQHPDTFYVGEDYQGLTLGSSLDGYHHGRKWLGKVLARVDCYENEGLATWEALDWPEEVKEFATKHKLTPKLILSFSYG